MNDYRIKGKEYIKRKLEYEGEYLNNKKWNGKGYDLEKGKIIYKIINGNGIIKRINDFGKLLFEANYSNGKLIGKANEYNNDGLLIFEGEYLNDRRWNGKYTKYNNNGKIIKKIDYINGNTYTNDIFSFYLLEIVEIIFWLILQYFFGKNNHYQASYYFIHNFIFIQILILILNYIKKQIIEIIKIK